MLIQENVFLALLSDRAEDATEITAEKIILIRNKSLRSSNANKTICFRRFVFPTIDVNAKGDCETTDLSYENITESSLIRHITKSKLANFRSDPHLF